MPMPIMPPTAPTLPQATQAPVKKTKPVFKTGPANLLQEGNKKPFGGSPTNFLKDKKKKGAVK